MSATNGKSAQSGHGCEGPEKTGANAIDVEHIVKKYGDFKAVDDVPFHVADEEIFGLLGPNGAGKSTLIRMMTTLLPITAGRAVVAGHDVAKDPDGARRCIGVIPQALTRAAAALGQSGAARRNADVEARDFLRARRRAERRRLGRCGLEVRAGGERRSRNHNDAPRRRHFSRSRLCPPTSSR